MLLASAIAVGAVGLGLALGLVPTGRTRVAGPLRTFALSAALTVVLLHLLPEAFAELGTVALLLFAATSVFPTWQRLVHGLFGSNDDGAGVHGGLVAGYVGLLVHHVGDGLGLGAYSALPGGAREHADVMLALAAHTVPLVAVVAFAFQGSGGSRLALRAAAGLALASVLGVLLSGVIPSASVERYSAWVAAFVAGLLVHVVTHDLGRDLPTTLGGRTVDFVAAAAGVAVSLVGGGHDGNHTAVFVGAAVVLAMALALPVLVGWVVVTLARSRIPMVLRGALEAAFGASLGLDALLLVLFLGGVVRGLIFAAGVFLLVRVVLAFSKNDPELVAPSPATPADAQWLARLDDVIGNSVAWTGAALAFFTLMASRFPQAALESLPLPVALALAVVVALPARVPAGAAVLIAAGLERGGLPFAAALVFALLAPAPGAVELTAVAHRVGRSASLRLALACVLTALGLGVVAALAASLIAPHTAPLFPQLTPRFAMLLLAALALRAAFDRSLRGLLLEVFPSHDTAGSHAETESKSGVGVPS